ncbi:MAG TPA: hypothetical protein VFY70_09625 [Thermomicrobiales bacterium]|jgi:hypothetical protein|nr:hypothetical protein [Thermomicrobiales bacterium]
MIDNEDVPPSGFTTSPWSRAGIATLNATGRDIPSVVEAGLRAVLTLAVAPPHTPIDTGRSAPINGAGDDLESLFGDLVEDLLSQIEFFGGGLHDVVLDGVLHRENGGYVGWGHASGTLDPAPQVVVPRLLGRPTVSRGTEPGIVLTASLQRS